MRLPLGLFLLALSGLALANDAVLNPLSFEADALKQDFNSSADRARMVVVLSPT